MTLNTNCALKGGRYISKIKPIFISEDEFIVIPAFKHLLVYSCNTGLLINKFTQHENEIIGLQINPNDTNEFISCSKTEFIKWDPEKGLRSRKELNLSFEPEYFLAPYKGLSFYFIGKNKKSESNYLACVNLKDPNKPEVKTIFSRINQNLDAVSFATDKSFIAAVFKTSLMIKDCESGEIVTHKRQREVTSVYCHPKDNSKLFLVEDSGSIITCHGLKDTKLFENKQHWHVSAPNSLAFSSEGHNYYSGGRERVLVHWSSHGLDKKFLPRLSAPIRHISVSTKSKLIALSMGDNSVQVVTSLLYPKFIICGLVRCPKQPVPIGASQSRVTTGLLIDPNSNRLVLNGHVGCLQVYNPELDLNEKNLDVTNLNFVPSFPGEIIYHWDVHKAIFSHKWMVTYSCRDDGDSTHFSSKLQFWWFKDSDNEFLPIHCLNSPHASKINALKFNPKKNEIATACKGGEIKFWAFTPDDGWHLSKTVKGYERKSILDCDYNETGTLLAASNEIALLFWGPEDIKSGQSIIHESAKNVTMLLFAKKECRQMLFTLSPNQLCCWDVNTLTLQRAVAINGTYLAADVNSNLFALFTLDKVFIFKPNEEKPLDTVPIKTSNEILGAVFWPKEDSSNGEDKKWDAASSLYYLSGNQTLFQVGAPSSNRPKLVRNRMQPIETPYGQIIKAKQTNEPVNGNSQSVLLSKTNKNKNFTNGFNNRQRLTFKQILDEEWNSKMVELGYASNEPEDVEMKNVDSSDEESDSDSDEERVPKSTKRKIDEEDTEQSELKKVIIDEEENEKFVRRNFSSFLDVWNSLPEKDGQKIF